MKNTEIIDETITWNKVENKMSTTQAEAPYLGAVQAKGTIDFDGFVKGVKDAGCSESELEIRRVLTKHEELMKDYVAQNYKVYCPYGIAGVHITKAFPAQDASFDPQVNEAIMSIQTNAETRNSLVGVTLKEDKAVAATLKGMKFNSVCTDGTRFGVVVCYQPFTVAGSGLHLNPAKSTDKLTFTNDKTGDVTEVMSYTCDGEGFRIDAQVNVSLTPGKYTLTGYADMGDAEHPNVHSATIKVTVEAGEAPVPPPPPIYESSLGGIKVYAAKDSLGDELPDDELNVPDTDAQLILGGEGLVTTDPEHPTTGISKVYFKSSDSAETCESTLTPVGEGKLALSLGMDSAVLEDGSYPNAKYIFFCYTDGESDSLEIPFRLHKGA